MQVKLDDSTKINISKSEDGNEFVLTVDGRTSMSFSRSEMLYIQALLDSALKEDQMSRDSLKKSLKDAAEKSADKLQPALRHMKTEDIAYAVWFAGSQSFTDVILANISKRSAEDVQTAVRETIERRIRKERAEGNKDIEKITDEKGRSCASAMLRKILET